MTDDFEPSATLHLATEESEAEAIAGELGPIESDDASMAEASLPRISDVTLEDGVDAVRWAYKKLLGRPEKVEPGGISIDIEDHEETTMRSSSTAHEDPPPPPGETSSSNDTENRDL